MNYIISEDEYNSIEAVRDQLRLVSDLCPKKDRGSSPIIMGDLGQFLIAQVRALTPALAAVYQRYEAGRAGAGMTASDWVIMIQILTGELDPRVLGGSGIGIKLAREAKVDDGMQRVLDAWLDALVSLGEKDRAAAAAPAAKATAARKREKLAQVPKAPAGKKPARQRERLSATAGV